MRSHIETMEYYKCSLSHWGRVIHICQWSELPLVRVMNWRQLDAKLSSAVVYLSIEHSGMCMWRLLGCPKHIMTLSNGNIFRGTGHLWGEFTGELPAQRSVTWSFDVFFDLCLKQKLSKQWRRRWFETPSRSLWRRCNELISRHNIDILIFSYILHMI